MLVYVPIEDRRNEKERRINADRRLSAVGSGCRRKATRRLLVPPPVVLPENSVIATTIKDNPLLHGLPPNTMLLEQNVNPGVQTQHVTTEENNVIAGSIIQAPQHLTVVPPPDT